MKIDDKLSAEYRARRDVDARPLFVVQEHASRSHHFDFRIEVDGVLKSWTVPKGPSTDPSKKRLAIAIRDHPLDFAEFEGVIPEGQDGAGTVIVWDIGPYENRTTDTSGEPVDIRAALEHGHAEIWLEGEKLWGGYILINSGFRGDDHNWSLIKMTGDGADDWRDPVNTQPHSVLSGRTVAEVANQYE